MAVPGYFLPVRVDSCCGRCADSGHGRIRGCILMGGNADTRLRDPGDVATRGIYGRGLRRESRHRCSARRGVRGPLVKARKDNPGMRAFKGSAGRRLSDPRGKALFTVGFMDYQIPFDLRLLRAGAKSSYRIPCNSTATEVANLQGNSGGRITTNPSFDCFHSNAVGLPSSDTVRILPAS